MKIVYSKIDTSANTVNYLTTSQCKSRRTYDRSRVRAEWLRQRLERKYIRNYGSRAQYAYSPFVFSITIFIWKSLHFEQICGQIWPHWCSLIFPERDAQEQFLHNLLNSPNTSQHTAQLHWSIRSSNAPFPIWINEISRLVSLGMHISEP